MSETSKTIDYYFSVLSPWTYMGDQRFRDMAKRYGFEVRHHPLLSPILFPATGGAALKDRAKPRLDYRLQELARWRKHLALTFNLQPKHFPIPEANATKLILAAQDAGEDVGPLTYAILCAVWEDEKDISDPATLQAIAQSVGLDGQALLAQSQKSTYDEKAEAETQAAIANGVFGYPTYVLGHEKFWGQDRLDFLERALSGDEKADD